LLSAQAPAAGSSSPGLVRKHTSADTAAAQRLLPRLVDFGAGWTAVPASAQEAALTCPGFEPRLPGVVETGAATSDRFQASPNGPFVSASSWVYRSTIQAATVWKRVVGDGLLGCFVRSVKAGSTPAVKLTLGSARRSPFPALSERNAAYRIVATARASGQSVATYNTLIVLGRDRQLAEVSLARVAAPVPRSTELSLARLVARRLR
jgi:hypothetical protein